MDASEFLKSDLKAEERFSPSFYLTKKKNVSTDGLIHGRYQIY